MRTTLSWIISAVILGLIGGAAFGYWEARPWTSRGGATPTAPQAADKDSSAAPAAAAEPQAEIGDTTFNFDKMESGTTQRHAFPIKNTGGAPLTITYVTHTCKCTSVEMNGKQVEPGASAVIKPGDESSIALEWAAKVPAGPFRHGATFTTNDPKHSKLDLHVEGNIVESTTLYPSQLNFGTIRVGQTGKAEMFVLSFVEPKVEITSKEVLDAKLAERLKVTIESVKKDELPSKDASAGVKVVAEYPAGGSIGPFGGSLKLKTNLKQAPNLEVPIFGNVKGDISFQAKGWSEPTGTLHLPPTDSAHGVSVPVYAFLRGPHAKTTKLSLKSTDPKELKVTLGEPKSISDKVVQVPMTVEFPPGTRPMVRAGEDQGGAGEIVLDTTHPDTKEVRMHVTFAIKP
jgi:hypothetical protein